MKAIQISGTREISLIEAPEPVITGADDVIVQIAGVSICGTDIHTYTNTHPFVKPPVIVGHECSGVVTAVGTAVENVKVGDRVAIDPVLGCGECAPCNNGRANACAQVKCRGVHVEGAMQELFKVRAQDVHIVPDALADLVLAAGIEPFAIGAQAVWRGNVSAGQTMVIFGAGPIGLTTMFMAMERGAECVLVDMKEDRLKNAVRLGAKGGVNAAAPDVKEQILAFTGAAGADVTCDAVGHPTIVDMCVELAAPTGCVVLLGMDGQKNNVTELAIFRKELTIVGSRMNSNMFPTVLELIGEGKLPLEAILTHRFTATEAAEAFEMAIRQPEGFCKAVIAF
ncbi:alcohol dehydrogenase catalytic domain-containing protein [Desulfosediminicola sp.]|uniref:alcohol dehydrogenase catalytic domain-containing protein n=1 Tax=Desulfosediminicola sp. TaxID=2886825 RepID=UPI003AF2ED9E